MAPSVRRRFVYLIFHADRYKIGVSHSPDGRAYQVSPGATVVHQIESAHPFLIERALHLRFFGHRLGGEWFTLTTEQADMIRTVARADLPHELPACLRVASMESVEVRVVLSLDVASSLEYVAASLGYEAGELIGVMLRGHLGEYRRLAEEVRRVREAG